MQRDPKKPTKRIATGRFKEDKSNGYQPTGGSNQTRRVSKLDKEKNQPKDDIWYQKRTRFPTVLDKDGVIISAHELEAIGSDFYRFILTPERAATSRIESPDELEKLDIEKINSSEEEREKFYKQKIDYSENLSINSQRNRAGFKDFSNYIKDMEHYKRIDELKEKLLAYGLLEDRDGELHYDYTSTKEISEECEKMRDEHSRLIHTWPSNKKIAAHLNEKYFNAKAGLWDIKLARRILSEGDENYGNTGLNNNGDLSIFDYDWTFYDLKIEYFLNEKSVSLQFDTIRNKDINELFTQAENELKDDQNALDRFYACQLRTLLLAETNAISPRHTSSSMLQKDIAALYLNNVQELKKSLVNSKGFKKYFAERLNFNDLENYCVNFFKHEKKHDPHSYEMIINSLHENYKKLSFELYSQKAETAHPKQMKTAENKSEENLNIVKTDQPTTSQTQPTNKFFAALEKISIGFGIGTLFSPPREKQDSKNAKTNEKSNFTKDKKL